MYLKLVGEDWCGTHHKARQDVTYIVGQVTMAPDWDPTPVCGGGLHYAERPEDKSPPLKKGHLLEVEPIGARVRIEAEKSKAEGLRVIREITAVPTPTEEPDAELRWWIATCIPTERLPEHLPTPAEEPDNRVRRAIAFRIARNRLPDRVPTPAEEPDVGVRWYIAGRIPLDRLPQCVPTPAEEPDRYVREWITGRICQGP